MPGPASIEEWHRAESELGTVERKHGLAHMFTSLAGKRGSDAPIGVFDSGVGGLTVLTALLSEMPNEHFVYLGDTARLPYGTKTPETVARYAVQAAEKLLQFDVKCIVVACNTASAAGLSAVRARAGAAAVIGVIEPGAKRASSVSASGRIAVLATEGTVRGGAYQRAISTVRPDARVTTCAAPLLVTLAEEGLINGSMVQSVLRHYLQPLFGPGDAACPDTLVLGCTHFPVLRDEIRRVVGPNVTIVDSAETTAYVVRESLAAGRLERTSGRGAVRLLATDGVERFARVGGQFLGRPLHADEIEFVDL